MENEKLSYLSKSIGLSGVNCYLSQYRYFPEPLAKKQLKKSEKLLKSTFQKIRFFLNN